MEDSRDEEGAIEAGHALYIAELPNPPILSERPPWKPLSTRRSEAAVAPLAVADSSATSKKCARSTRWITSWAMRSPR